MGLKVIGAGFGRTGTRSLKNALEQLGFTKCYTMEDVMKNRSHCQHFIDAKEGKNVDWYSLFDGYAAAVDWPVSAFYKQLMVQYPDAKVILTVRDSEQWYRSTAETIYKARHASFEGDDVMLPMINGVIWNGTFDGKFLDKEHATKVFENHIAEVKAHVPAGKLLIFQAKDGWAPLCKFLDVEVPTGPFPHLNNRDSFKRVLNATENGGIKDDKATLSPHPAEEELARSFEKCSMSQRQAQCSAEEKATGLRIIGAGFGRTGTLSLSAALEQLGFTKCYHMKDAVANPSHFDGFLDAMNGKAVDWDDLFSGYKATVDWPACPFYKQLMAKYPDAKVILSVRDPERWYESARDSIFAAMTLAKTDAANPVVQRIEDLVWKGTFHGRFDDKKHAIEVFEQHIADVKAYVPADKLLVFSVKDGWEPLCRFVGKPIPEGPFPHLNDRETFRKMMRGMSATE